MSFAGAKIAQQADELSVVADRIETLERVCFDGPVEAAAARDAAVLVRIAAGMIASAFGDQS